MDTFPENTELAERFRLVARSFCDVVDGASGMDRTDLLTRVYPLLPKLIDEALGLPDVSLDDDDQLREDASRRFVNARQDESSWGRLYTLLKERLGDWDSYRQVFDPTEDQEAIFGSLADDIADIYRDLYEGLVLYQVRPAEATFKWRLLFYSHWGKHAIDALLTTYFRLQNVAA